VSGDVYVELTQFVQKWVNAVPSALGVGFAMNEMLNVSWFTLFDEMEESVGGQGSDHARNIR